MLDSLCSEAPSTLLAFLFGLGLVLACGSVVIRLLALCCRETIRQDSPRLAALLSCKAATPTMGGLLILAGFLAAVCSFGNLSQASTIATVVLSVCLGGIGIWDDLCKRRPSRRGISPRVKLLAQFLIAVPIVLWLANSNTIANDVFSLVAAVLLITGLSNAVNLTDGLDGLASGCSLLVLAAAAVMFGLLPTSDSMRVPPAALAGSVLGFLWFNRQPARVFMGDTGSLPLGGLLGLFIALSPHKLPLLLACGVFLMEAASVVVQVSWFKTTGRRVFRCAPLHHHFQFLGWPERRIVAHFWLAGLLCGLLGCGVQLMSLPPARVVQATSLVPLNQRLP